MTKPKHLDCQSYTAIDVFKGLCRRHKQMRMADEDGCDDFDPAKKCKLCKHFTEDEEHLGACMGKTFVYPDLLARTCQDFEWKP